MTTCLITVKGLVQGVFFRQSTRQKALELQLTGFVENRPDGTVQIHVTGEMASIEQLARWCQHGPPQAAVEKVDMITIETEHYDGFSIRRN